MLTRTVSLAVAVLLLVAAVAPSTAQEVGYVAAVREIRREASGRRVLFVAARDDAIDGPTLAWLADDRHARTTIVVVSRSSSADHLRATARELSADLRSLDRPSVGLARFAGEVFEVWDLETTAARLASVIREVDPHLVLVGRAPRPDRGAFDATAALVAKARTLAKAEGSALFVADPSSADLVPDVERVDALRGRSYAELGGRPDAGPRYGRSHSPAKVDRDPFAGVPAGAVDVDALLSGAPESLARRLADAGRTGAAFRAAIGLSLVIEVDRSGVVPGDEFDVRVGRRSGSGWEFSGEKIELTAGEGWSFERVEAAHFRVTVDDDVVPSGPLEDVLIARWTARVTTRLGERPVALDVAVPVRVVPRLEFLGLPPDPIGIADNVRGAGRLELPIDLRNHGAEPLSGSLRITVDPTHPDPIVEELELAGRGVGTTVHLEIPLPEEFDEDELEITIVADFPGARSTISRRVRFLDVRTESDLRVGLIDGRDSALRRGLAQLGVETQRLGPAVLRGVDLLRFDTIVIDRGVLALRTDVHEARARLLAYVTAGGNLVVFGQAADAWQRMGGLAPLEIEVGDGFVSASTSAVTVDDPDHLLLTRPNALGAETWRGWVRERGRDFPVRWHPSYASLLGTSDPGEAMLIGGLLVVESGKGAFVYTPLSFGPQLDAAVPGAYRLLANLISYPLVKVR